MTVVAFSAAMPDVPLEETSADVVARMAAVLCHAGLLTRSASPIERTVGYVTLRLSGFSAAAIIQNFELAIRAARLIAFVPSRREGGIP